MEAKTGYYLVAAEALPDVFLKVAEANRLLLADDNFFSVDHKL